MKSLRKEIYMLVPKTRANIICKTHGGMHNHIGKRLWHNPSSWAAVAQKFRTT